MFKRSVNFSPFEKDQLLQLIREYIVIFEDKRLDGVGRREKERAWLELTDRYNSLENVNLRTSRQLQACWKNLKNRARDITEACKKGTEFPFFTLSNKFNSSYLPSTDDDDGYDIQVKSEHYSDPEEGEVDRTVSGVLDRTNHAALLSQVYSIASSSTPSSPVDSPPVFTNYVYSPTTSLPPVFVPTPSSLPSASSSTVSTPSSKPSSQEGQSDIGSHRVDSIAARLTYTLPSYRTPERSLSKSVERIANSILFERGVSDELPASRLFDGGRPSDLTSNERNGSSLVDLSLKLHSGSDHVSKERNGLSNLASRERNGVPLTDSVSKERNYYSALLDSHIGQEEDESKCNNKGGHVNQFRSVKSNSYLDQIGLRKTGSTIRSRMTGRAMAASAPGVGVNGHSPAGRVSKAARYRRLEHQTRMKNLKFERDCLETEHRLRCELLQMKIQYYKKKSEGGM